MSDRGEDSILGRLAYAVGYTIGRADVLIDDDTAGDPAVAPSTPYPTGRRNDHETAETTAHRPAPRERSHWPTGAEMLGGATAGAALGSLAASWVLSRFLRPRPIHWPRAVIAGIAGTALADLVQNITQQGSDDHTPFPPGVEDLPRYAAGIATAAAYGAQLYPRLPGSPLTRGLIFGTVEAVVAESGGALGLLQRVAPDVRLPLAPLATYAPPHRGALESLAFGLGLALYSTGRRRR